MLGLDEYEKPGYSFCSAYVPFAGAVMIPLSCFSRAALAAGIPARYLYWFGRSGRRYLFTCTEPGGIGDFADGIAILVSAGEIIWTGEIAALASAMRSGGLPEGALYVHLLATRAEERRAVIADLRPVDGAHLRLAA